MFNVEYIHCSPTIQQNFEQFIQSWYTDLSEITVQTSGSTGTPKNIQLTKNQCIASAKRTNAYFNLTENSVVLLAINPTTIAAKMMIIRAIIGNYSIIITEPSKNPFQHIPAQNFDFIPLVPFQLDYLITHCLERLIGHKAILLGGSPPTDQLVKKITNLNLPVFVGFGMTETVSHVAIKKVFERNYTALSGVTFSQNNGCLIVNDSELEIKNLLTTDLVEFISETSFNWFGRADFVINSGGIKLHPEKLEAIAAGFISGQFMFMGLPDNNLGEKCVLILDENASISSLDKLQQELQVSINKYAAPKEIIRFNFPQTEYKLNRRKYIQQILEFL